MPHRPRVPLFCHAPRSCPTRSSPLVRIIDHVPVLKNVVDIQLTSCYHPTCSPLNNPSLAFILNSRVSNLFVFLHSQTPQFAEFVTAPESALSRLRKNGRGCTPFRPELERQGMLQGLWAALRTPQKRPGRAALHGLQERLRMVCSINLVVGAYGSPGWSNSIE
jgi:hypothetical protein